MRRRPPLRAVIAAVLVLPATAACSSTSCEDLSALQAQRDAERAAYLKLVQSGASSEVAGAADDKLHELERRVYEAEQRCAD